MRLRHSAMPLVALAVITTSVLAPPGAAGADDVTSYSYPQGIVFTGGGPAAGQFAADRVVVTRSRQFAQFGRAGHVEPLETVQYAGSDGRTTDAVEDGSPLKVVKTREDPRYPHLVDRFGRE